MARTDRGAGTDMRQRRTLQAMRVFPERITPVQTATYAPQYGELVLCDPTGGGFTINLPTAVGCTGRQIGVKNASASGNTITVDAFGSETIDGTASTTITSGLTAITLVSDGSDWWII